MTSNDCTEFIYAGYLPQGLQKFLIYSPIKNKVYFKEIMVEFNTAEVYPQRNFGKKKKVKK